MSDFSESAALAIPMFTRAGKRVLEIRKFDQVTRRCACVIEGGALRSVLYNNLAHHFGERGKRAHFKAAGFSLR